MLYLFVHNFQLFICFFKFYQQILAFFALKANLQNNRTSLASTFCSRSWNIFWQTFTFAKSELISFCEFFSSTSRCRVTVSCCFNWNKQHNYKSSSISSLETPCKFIIIAIVNPDGVSTKINWKVLFYCMLKEIGSLFMIQRSSQLPYQSTSVLVTTLWLVEVIFHLFKKIFKFCDLYKQVEMYIIECNEYSN